MSDCPLPTNASDDRAASRGALMIGFLFIAGLLIAFRAHAFTLPLETDECNYAYIGGRLLAGDRLYVDAWDHQPPGVYALFAGVIALFGDEPFVFRMLALGFSLVSLGLVWSIARRMSGLFGAIIAGLLFAMVSSDPGVAGEGCNREIYMNTLILAAWWWVLRDDHCNWRNALPAGAMLALASVVKTIVAVHWFALAFWLLIAAWRARHWRDGLRAVLWLGLGPLALWVATFAYFGATGRFAEFFDATFRFNLGYAAGDASFVGRFVEFFAPERHRAIFASAFPLWIGGALALIGLLLRDIVQRRPRSAPVWFYVLASYVAAALPAHFWPHYYYLLIPPLVIALAIGICDASRLVTRALSLSGSRVVIPRIAVSGLVLGLVLWTEVTHYLRQPPFGITVMRYNSRDFWGRALGENVAAVTEPDDTIFVYGNEAEVYYYAKRRCASRFTMITGLAEGSREVAERRAQMLDDLRRNRPRVVILLFDQPPFVEWKAFLDAHYGQPVGADFHDRTGKVIMLVMADRENPIETVDWNWDRSQVGGWFPDEGR